MARQKKEIAPRLASGLAREINSGRLAPEIKTGLQAIARLERKSMSWVIEQVLCEFFHIRLPRYVREVRPIKHRRVSALRRVA